MALTEEQYEEVKALAATLRDQLPARSDERVWAADIAKGKGGMSYGTIKTHFQRVCEYVVYSNSPRYSKDARDAATKWLARYGTKLLKEEVRGAKRVEMRLSVAEYEDIKKRAERAGLSMANYCRWLVFGGDK